MLGLNSFAMVLTLLANDSLTDVRYRAFATSVAFLSITMYSSILPFSSMSMLLKNESIHTR